MKRKDALWVMQMCRDRDARSEAEREAFDTAIEALKSESIFTADRPRGEWVSKKELIDAINDMEVVYDGDEDEHKEHDISKLVRVMFKDIIDNLPSADMRGETE